MKDHIRNCLSGITPRHLTKGFIREAAVLIPVFELDEEYHFLLTRRTETVQTHKGQISFPGGMREGDEELMQTAIRETFEEVGIPEDKMDILGRFHDYISITEYRVTPFVALLHTPFTVRPQANEVAEVLHVPFETFLDPSLLRIGRTEFEQKDVNVYYYSYGAHQIWGLTARIIKEFLEMLKLRP